MSSYVLDTDILSLYRENHEGVRGKVDSRPGELAITVMSLDEQLSGWYTLARKARSDGQLAHAYHRLADTVRFLGEWQMLPLSETAIEIARGLRSTKPKIRVGTNDLFIAVICLEHNATLVTRNLRDFQRIPGWKVEDWSV